MLPRNAHHMPLLLRTTTLPHAPASSHRGNNEHTIKLALVWPELVKVTPRARWRCVAVPHCPPAIGVNDKMSNNLNDLKSEQIYCATFTTQNSPLLTVNSPRLFLRKSSTNLFLIHQLIINGVLFSSFTFLASLKRLAAIAKIKRAEQAEGSNYK